MPENQTALRTDGHGQLSSSGKTSPETARATWGCGVLFRLLAVFGQFLACITGVCSYYFSAKSSDTPSYVISTPGPSPTPAYHASIPELKETLFGHFSGVNRDGSRWGIAYCSANGSRLTPDPTAVNSAVKEAQDDAPFILGDLGLTDKINLSAKEAVEVYKRIQDLQAITLVPNHGYYTFEIPYDLSYTKSPGTNIWRVDGIITPDERITIQRVTFIGALTCSTPTPESQF